jgi:hypothetical protein
MNAIFPVFPQVLFYPSYRSTLTWVVVLVAVPLSYFYINAAKFVVYVKRHLLYSQKTKTTSDGSAKRAAKKNI